MVHFSLRDDSNGETLSKKGHGALCIIVTQTPIGAGITTIAKNLRPRVQVEILRTLAAQLESDIEAHGGEDNYEAQGKREAEAILTRADS